MSENTAGYVRQSYTALPRMLLYTGQAAHLQHVASSQAAHSVMLA